MRLPRLILEPEACDYHCIDRTVERVWFFDTPKRRDRVVEIIWACADLYGTNLMNYAVLSNHIHLLAQMRSKANRKPLTKNEFTRARRIDRKTAKARCGMVGIRIRQWRID